MPNSQYPQVTAGEILTASLLQSFSPLAAWKTSTTTFTGTTLTIDPDLQLTVAASATYEVTASLVYQTPVAGHFKWSWSIPSGASGGYAAAFNLGGSGVGTYGQTWAATLTASAGTAGTNYGATIIGILVTSSGGTFGLTWNNDTAADTAILGVGSLLVARRIA